MWFSSYGYGAAELRYKLQTLFRAIASDRETEALASVISFVFVAYNHHHKHPKYPEGKFNSAQTLPQS